MKRLNRILSVLVLFFINFVVLNAQTWQMHSNGMYLKPMEGNNSSVGIGCVPYRAEGKLTIKAASSQAGLRVMDAGNVTRLLQVNGGLGVGSASTPPANGLAVSGDSRFSGLLSVGTNVDSRHRLKIKTAKNQDGLRILDESDTTRLWQTNAGLSVGSWVTPPRRGLYVTGSVGIGVANPKAKLHVAGKIICEQELKVAEIRTKDITVEMNNAADYVFDEDYNLKSLSEVEEYVKENKHLPGVPSASEMADKGVSVSEMSNLLLEKIEELTLHLIRLEKENKELKSLIEGFNK